MASTGEVGGNGPYKLSMALMMATLESVVLLDARGNAVGEHDKSTVHHSKTPLHLAFSLYLFDPDGRVLLTRRALSKVTWPGVWTNSCCGHPGPGESMTDAIARRVLAELGLAVEDVRSILPDFAYQARDASGIWENEICPVFSAVVAPSSTIKPNVAEVMEFAWSQWSDLVAAMSAAPFAFSPWAVEQVALLTAAAFEPEISGSNQHPVGVH